MKNISSLIEDFVKTGFTQTLHIDLLGNSTLDSKGDIFRECLLIVNKATSLVEENDYRSLQIQLQVELTCVSNKIKGVPKTLSELIEEIDSHSVPEIGIIIPRKEFWNPKLEMYFSPLPYEVLSLNDRVSCIYEEYRTLEEAEEDLEFNRWLTFSYLSL